MSGQVSRIQQLVAYDCQLLSLGNEYHLLLSEHAILQSKEKHKQNKYDCHYVTMHYAADVSVIACYATV